MDLLLNGASQQKQYHQQMLVNKKAFATRACNQ